MNDLSSLNDGGRSLSLTLERALSIVDTKQKWERVGGLLSLIKSATGCPYDDDELVVAAMDAIAAERPGISPRTRHHPKSARRVSRNEEYQEVITLLTRAAGNARDREQCGSLQSSHPATASGIVERESDEDTHEA